MESMSNEDCWCSCGTYVGSMGLEEWCDRGYMCDECVEVYENSLIKQLDDLEAYSGLI